MSHSRPLEVFVLKVVELENKTFFSSKFTITELKRARDLIIEPSHFFF